MLKGVRDQDYAIWWARKEGGVKEEWEEQVLIRVGGVRVYFDVCEIGGAHGEGTGEILVRVRLTPRGWSRTW